MTSLLFSVPFATPTNWTGPVCYSCNLPVFLPSGLLCCKICGPLGLSPHPESRKLVGGSKVSAVSPGGWSCLWAGLVCRHVAEPAIQAMTNGLGCGPLRTGLNNTEVGSAPRRLVFHNTNWNLGESASLTCPPPRGTRVLKTNPLQLPTLTSTMVFL